MKKRSTPTMNTIIPIDKPIFIRESEEELHIKSNIRFNKDVTLEGFSGIIICPKEVFFYGRIIFKKCECHIICSEEPNIFNQVLVTDSTLTIEGVPENYTEQLSEDVLKINRSKIYT